MVYLRVFKLATGRLNDHSHNVRRRRIPKSSVIIRKKQKRPLCGFFQYRQLATTKSFENHYAGQSIDFN